LNAKEDRTIFVSTCVTKAAFGQTLLALKIYNTRYVHYRFSALIASARMQPKWKAPIVYVCMYVCVCVYIYVYIYIFVDLLHIFSLYLFHIIFLKYITYSLIYRKKEYVN